MGRVMKVTKSPKPALIQLFENLLWAHSPKNWVLKSTYFQGKLFVSMLIVSYDQDKYQKIRRNFDLNVINSRSFDICGLALDCVEEMKTEIR